MTSAGSFIYSYPGVHVYDGMVLHKYLTAAGVEAAKTYPFKEEDVLIVTYPKSGTTWMQEIVWLLKNDCDFQTAGNTNLDERCRYLEWPERNLTPEPQVSNVKSEKIIKTHLKYHILTDAIQQGNPKVIVVLRNPKDVLVSMFHFYQMNGALGNYSGPWDEFFEMFRNKQLNYGYWYDHVLDWWENKEKLNIHFVKYEDMKKKPFDIVSEIAAFLHASPSQKQIDKIIKYTHFDKMKDNNMVNKKYWRHFDHSVSEFLRKGVIGDWKNYFSESQNNFMDGLLKNLEERGLSFECE